ncbi:RNA-directed DNA polymerase [Colwellia sp. MB3u-70]|nr:RNA-directed DNA polymerase [Colwellia sp. MB3u-8]MBA6308077.1 RNA-directed DNA polymerase [Colwellia sp. MB3u-70]
MVSVDSKLKSIQTSIKEELEEKYPTSKFAHAFISNNLDTLDDIVRPKGVISNALAHTNKKVVISIDLKDFFPTISFPRVLGMFKQQPYFFSNKQASILASLVCLPKGVDANRGLPQGAPSSPLISNLICNKIDKQLGQLAKKLDCIYTRYADDITFSTNNINRVKPSALVNEIRKHVVRNGFEVNEEKTKIMFSNQRQMVTGIVVNDGLNLHKRHVDALRATLYNLEFKYKTTSQGIKAFWKLGSLRSFDSLVPVGFIKGETPIRFVKSASKEDGKKRLIKTTGKYQVKTYALHILGRILWYGQVVTTAISDPYSLSKNSYISPKQERRIKKFEEMLAAYYRIADKLNWPVKHIILRLANKYPHLQSLIHFDPRYTLKNIALLVAESDLITKVNKLGKDNQEYLDFYKESPETFQRHLLLRSRFKQSFKIHDIRTLAENGWVDPKLQNELFEELNTRKLADLFHKSDDGKGHKVEEILLELVKVVAPKLRYLSSNVRTKVLQVHKEFVGLIGAEGKDVKLDLEIETDLTKSAIQAIRDLKNATRLYEHNNDTFYSRIVLPSINDSDTTKLVDINTSGMAPRLITEIGAWKKALTKVLQSIKESASKVNLDSKQKPFKIKFKDANPVTGEPVTLEIFKVGHDNPFGKNLNLPENSSSGFIQKNLLGRDLTNAIEQFLPVGDIYVQGNFKDVDNAKINLTRHKFERIEEMSKDNKESLFFVLKEYQSK